MIRARLSFVRLAVRTCVRSQLIRLRIVHFRLEPPCRGLISAIFLKDTLDAAQNDAELPGLHLNQTAASSLGCMRGARRSHVKSEPGPLLKEPGPSTAAQEGGIFTEAGRCLRSHRRLRLEMG